MTAREVVIVASGGANIASLQFALDRLGATSTVCADPDRIRAASHVILPGVGAAADAMARLRRVQLDVLLPTLRQPVLGICLGMQLLFEGSDEGGMPGLGVLEGRVRTLPIRRRPHIGWERVDDAAEPTLSASSLRWGYYAHSYGCPLEGSHAVTSTSLVEGVVVPATIRSHRTLGVQFHPEKSSAPGVAMVRAFVSEVAP